MSQYLLSLIVFTPLLGALILLFLKDQQHNLIRQISFAACLIQLVFSVMLGFGFKNNPEAESIAESFQFVEKTSWISLDLGSVGRFNIDYHIGVDGISMPLIILSSLVLVIGVISSWNIASQVRGYFILYLILGTSIVGCFLALDFFLFYLFFELMLLPMFFLIGIWGGPRRSYASIKFFIYTLVGSLLILIVMIALYLSVIDPDLSSDGLNVHTFNLLHMMNGDNYLIGSTLVPGTTYMFMGSSMRAVAFLALMIGFAIKLPAVPVHTWLPDAHVEAPTPISVILAALLLKVGGYGFYRIAYSIFPDGAIMYAYPVAIFGVLAIVYGGFNAMAQRDLKKLIAYSSVSHMGFVLVGLAALTTEGVSGGLFQMISHGLISAALFLVAGVLYDRTHNRLIENYSGLASKLPQYTFVVVIVFFASLGLPGMSGFVGELLVLMGAFGSTTSNEFLPHWIGIVSVTGIIISAAYYLWTLQRMFFGKYWIREESWGSLKDLTTREWLMFTPLIIFILLLGIFPKLLLDPMNQSVNLFVDHVMIVGKSYLNL